MKKNNIKFLIISIYFLISANAAAQDTSSVFWEISGNSLIKPSYLFGTVHMIGESDFFMPDSLEEKFKNSDQVVLELDMDDPDLLKKTQKLMFMPFKNLRELLTINEYKIVEKFFQDSLGLPVSQLQQIKPIFLAQFIIPKIINEPMASYELAFVKMAGDQKKEIIGLETMEDQVKVLDKIPLEKQAELIYETIKDINKERILYKQLIEAYKKMDLQDIYKLMLEISKEFKEYEENLLIDRNKKWIPKIQNIIEEKPSFIAVGALHLEGENGLVTLLREKGYRLKPLF